MSERSEEHPGIDVRVERTEPCRAKVTFTVTADEYGRRREESMRTLAKRIRHKGFRPGKAPKAMVEKRFGPEVDRDTIERFLNRAYDIAIKENELRPAASPRVDVEALAPPASGAALEHAFEVLLRPDVELGQYRGMEVQRGSNAVADEELEAALADVRRQHSRPEPAGDDGLAADGLAVCRLECLTEGAEEPVFSRDGVRLSPATPPLGIAPEAFGEALTGAKEGEVRTFDVTFPEDFPEEALRNAAGTCRITVTQAFRIVAPEDTELYGMFEVEDDEGLRKAVRERIAEAKDKQEDARIEDELLKRLLEAHPLDLPEPLVSEQVEARMAETARTLEAEGVEEAEREQRLAEERERAQEGTARAMRAIYLMEEIAKKEGLEVTEQDLLGEMKDIAARNQADLAEVRKYYQQEGLISQLALELLERKVRRFLRESAAVQ